MARISLNPARGVHVVKDDLLGALDSGKVKGAMLVLLIVNPLPPESPPWQISTRDDNNYVAAITRPAEAGAIFATTAQPGKGERGLEGSHRARGY